MKSAVGLVAALAFAAGFGLVSTSWAQPQEGCEVVTGDITGVGSEANAEGSNAPAPHVGDPDMAEGAHDQMEGSVEGSNAPMPGRGDCDDIDASGRKTEG